MKVTVCFDHVRVVVPCGDGSLLVRDLMREAILRYKKATGKNESWLIINSLSSMTGGGLLDPDDRLCDVADDREQIVAHFVNGDTIHAGGDGASSIGTDSPDFFHLDSKEPSSYPSNIRRESAKRLSMHSLSTREPCLAHYSVQSLPRESRRKEPLGQAAKTQLPEFPKDGDHGAVREVLIKNDAGPLGLHVVPCYDLLGNDQGLRVEGIEPNGRIARDGQIDLHDKIVQINGHNLLRRPFAKVQEIFTACMNEPCLRISVIKNSSAKNGVSPRNFAAEKHDAEDTVKRLQSGNYNLLRSANTRKIGRRIEIELTKGSNGLGFSVTTRDNPAGGHCPIYIKNILPKGAAVEDGRLRPGDRLLEVNKMEMTGKNQAEVVSLLRSILPGGKVRMLVSRQEDCQAVPNDSTVPVLASPDPASASSWDAPAQSPTAKEQEKPNDSSKHSEDVVLSPRKNRMILTLDIPVHDSEKAGLGVSVKGKTSSADDNSNVDLGIFIKSVLHGGAASRDGRLRTNDQLLNVNGVSLLGLSNSDAMETLRRAMLSTNSSVTGVITLTIARRVSSYDRLDVNFQDIVRVEPGNFSTAKSESVNRIFVPDKHSESNVRENNNLNCRIEPPDSNLAASSPWNPVIDRLTEQYNKNSLRNESYCIATDKTWLEPVSKAKKISSQSRESGESQFSRSRKTPNRDSLESILTEESSGEKVQESRRTGEDKDSQGSGDPTYDSQLSLEELSTGENKFSRDALGRQSMSEKRHAALDAKSTDTYKRNKKLREGKDTGSADSPEKTQLKVEKVERVSREPENRKVPDSEYLYTIPGRGKFISPRKHWLVDDEVQDGNNYREERDGFSNSRGDVKQASLNSALDERYKRSRKKGGIRSMLRLGKNRKSLNFGDNIETRQDSNNYCSGTINYIA